MLTKCNKKTDFSVLDWHLLQGEGSVVTGLSPASAMLRSPQAQAMPMNFSENTDGDTDPKTGNTCNALSGTGAEAGCSYSCEPHSSTTPHSPFLLVPLQVRSQVCLTSLASGGRVGGAVSTRRFPAAAWPLRHPSTRRCTAWAASSATSWTLAWTSCRNSSTGMWSLKSLASVWALNVLIKLLHHDSYLLNIMVLRKVVACRSSSSTDPPSSPLMERRNMSPSGVANLADVFLFHGLERQANPGY